MTEVFPQARVDLWVQGEEDATELFYEHHPRAIQVVTKIRRAASLLHNAMKEIRTVFPDANYYSANDGFCLLLGSSHSGDGEQPQQQRLVTTGHRHLPSLSGGDW